MRKAMKALITIITSIILLVLIAFTQKQPSKKQIEKGKELSKMCTNCHGTTKKISAFPQLTKSDIDAIYDYLDSLPFDEKEYKHRK